MNRSVSRAAALVGCLTIALGLLAACGAPSTAQTPGATATASSSTAPGSAASTPAASTPAAGDGPRLAYLDDRSTGAAVIASLYNAINFKQYARAYSYWQSMENAPSFADFQQGYEGVEEVQLRLGTVSSSAGAGQVYSTVPVALTSIRSDGSTQTFVGCYTLHLANPGIQAAPPFQPLGIDRARVQQVDNSADTNTLLAQACAQQNQQSGAQPIPSQSADPADISASRYLDDRSSPVQVLRSLGNAINSRQYARAYSYWQHTQQAPPFDQFEQGYANTRSVQIETGTVSEDAGAGQLNASVPVTLIATMSDQSTQIFVGCYELHLANPGIQATPPFTPWGITKAEIKQVDRAANTTELMAQACANS